VVEAIYDCALDSNRWQATVRQIVELSETQICNYPKGCCEFASELADNEPSMWLDEALIGRLGGHRCNSRCGERSICLWMLLAPHVRRALAISDAVNVKSTWSQSLTATLNKLASGVYLTDCHGRVIYMNRAGDHLLRSNKALCIEHGRLAPVDQITRVAMSKAVAAAIADDAEATTSGVTLVLPTSEGARLIAIILPLSHREGHNRCSPLAAAAAIFVHDPLVVPSFAGEAFAKAHGLTSGELRVLLAMSPGLGVKEAAEMLGISETTAKTHLHHIFAKTGTSRQAQLMHLFMTCALVFPLA
jgi:DNA-binding CsgD family transcriptional regulator